MAEGLDRHEAIHAVASVFMEYTSRAMQDESATEFPTVQYDDAVKQLTAEGWRRSSEDEAEDLNGRNGWPA
ncbi:MAG: hypothetical protein WDN69_33930 [Aliidongia sp.]